MNGVVQAASGERTGHRRLDLNTHSAYDGLMVNRKRASSKGKDHRFGGDWTTTKLDVIEGYLAAYTTALSAQPFRLAYIDAFAGTGYRTMRSDDGERPEDLLFPDLADSASQGLLDGSARRALKVTPRFDRYIFIEKNAARCQALELLRDEFPALASDIRIVNDEANAAIQGLCTGKNWKSSRAVLFLDPYGMQVEWKTLEAIAATKAIDLWLLFPLGIGVNRLVTRSGEIPESWRACLDRLFGNTDWYREFYSVETTTNLFGEVDETVTKTSVDVIARYFNDRLGRLFADVAKRPGVLRNRSNSPLYLLCFAASNAKGAPVALRIAESLLKKVR